MKKLNVKQIHICFIGFLTGYTHKEITWPSSRCIQNSPWILNTEKCSHLVLVLSCIKETQSYAPEKQNRNKESIYINSSKRQAIKYDAFCVLDPWFHHTIYGRNKGIFELIIQQCVWSELTLRMNYFTTIIIVFVAWMTAIKLRNVCEFLVRVAGLKCCLWGET